MTTSLIQEECANGIRTTDGPDVVARATALRLKLRERATETDRLARLPEATIADLERARLFEITTPRIYGGLQLDVRAYMDAMVELGRGDASVSWVATLVNINNWFVATLFPPEVSERVFAKPGARVAAVLQPRSCKVRKVSGGFQIEEGVWAFNSGIYHAQWDILGFSVQDETGGSLVFALVPKAEVQILDDWDTIGVRGSGSSSVAVRDVFVPDIRVVRADSAQFGKYKSTQFDHEGSTAHRSSRWARSSSRFLRSELDWEPWMSSWSSCRGEQLLIHRTRSSAKRRLRICNSGKRQQRSMRRA